MRDVRSRSRLLAAVAVAVTSAAWAAVPAAPSYAEPVAAAFSGTASAVGVEFFETAPGLPVSNTLVDGGGPTAQAAADSLGSSTGYAAFPDPGSSLATVPGTAVGLLSGIIPVTVPSLPNYPLYVASDVNTNKHGAFGTDDYRLTSDSAAQSSQASASIGVNGAGLANASSSSSTASVARQPDGGVVSQAASDVYGLAVGPLTFGHIHAEASETLDADGILTPGSELEIDGLKVGGLPVAVTPTGITTPGPPVPLPIDATLKSILAPTGITVDIERTQQSSNRVASPAIQITGPFSVPGFSTAKGTFVLTIGSTTAHISSSPVAPAAVPTLGPGAQQDGTVPTTPGSTGPTAGTTLGAPGTPSIGDTGAADLATTSSSLASGPAPAVAPDAGGQLATRAVTVGFVGGDSFDIRSLYLVAASVAVAALLLGQAFRFVGVRGPWSSFGG